MRSSQFAAGSSQNAESPASCELQAASFTPAWFLRGPHAQTVWGRVARPRQLVQLRREVLVTPDDDDLVLDHLDGVGAGFSRPAHDRPAEAGRYTARFILLHGLEGSSYSVYMQGLSAAIAARGLAATAMNFRSCARDPRSLARMLPNRQRRLYHSGETTDLDFLVRTLRAREPDVKLFAAGASLGGNVLLKWLGEHPGQTDVTAAAAMSVPYDLAAGADYLEHGMGRFYVARFLRTLKEKARTRTGLDLDTVMRARTFRQFDDAATGPLHGFAGADDYYTQSSSLRFLDRITTPTLCLSAEDDPFLPREALDRARQAASPSIEFRVTPRGGHTGFISGAVPWRCQYWAEELMVRWLVER
jgi:predicted alpha/beta-fold hydrolase